MQEDENPYEQEKHLPYENWAGESQPESQEQPASESVAGESQPEQEPQPPPAAPTPLPLTEKQKRRQYLQGLGWGLIPLIVFLACGGILRAIPGENSLGLLIFVFPLGVISYIIELIVTIVYLSNKQRRFVGYGLLTAFLATPVIAYVGCMVITTA